ADRSALSRQGRGSGRAILRDGRRAHRARHPLPVARRARTAGVMQPALRARAAARAAGGIRAALWRPAGVWIRRRDGADMPGGPALGSRRRSRLSRRPMTALRAAGQNSYEALPGTAVMTAERWRYRLSRTKVRSAMAMRYYQPALDLVSAWAAQDTELSNFYY